MDLLGKKFSSYWEVDAFLKKYEIENNIQLICHKSTKLNSKTILKNVSKKGKLASKLNRALEYYNLIYRCAYGVRKRQSEVSFEKPCPFFIQFRLASDCQKLLITSAVVEHKHIDSKPISENTLKRKKPLDLNECRNDIKETIVPTKKLTKKIRKKSEIQIPPLVWYPIDITKPDVSTETISEGILFSGNARKRKSLEVVNDESGSSPRSSKKSSSHIMKENTAINGPPMFSPEKKTTQLQINEPSVCSSEKKTTQLQSSELPQTFLKMATHIPKSSAVPSIKRIAQDIPPLSLLKTCVSSTSIGNIIANMGSVVISEPSVSTDNKRGLSEKSINSKVSSQSLGNDVNKVPPLALLKNKKSLNATCASIISNCSSVMINKNEQPPLPSNCKLKDFSQSHSSSVDTSLKNLNSSSPAISVKNQINGSSTSTSERNLKATSPAFQASTTEQLKRGPSCYSSKSATPSSADKSLFIPQASESSVVTCLSTKVVKEEAAPPVPPLAFLSSAASGLHKCNSSLPMKCTDKPSCIKVSSVKQEEQQKLVNSTVCSSTFKNVVNNSDLDPSPMLSTTIKTSLTKSVPPLAILRTNVPLSSKNISKNENDHCYAKVVSSNSEQTLPIPPLAAFSGGPVHPSQPNPPRPQISSKILPSTKEKELIPDVPPLTILKKSAHPSMNKNSVSKPSGKSTLPMSLVTEHPSPETNIPEKNKTLKTSDLIKTVASKITLEPPPLKSFSSSTCCNGKKEILNSPFISGKPLQKDVQSCQSAPPLTPFSACSGENQCANKQNQLKPDPLTTSAPKGLQDSVPPLTLIKTGTTIPHRMKSNPSFPFPNLPISNKSDNQEDETPLQVSKLNSFPDLGQTSDNDNMASASSSPTSVQQIDSLSKNETVCHNKNENDYSIFNDYPSSSYIFIKSEPHSPPPEKLSYSPEVRLSEEYKTQNISFQDQSNYDKAMVICQELCKDLTRHSPNDFNKVFKSLEFLRDCVKDKVPFIISTWKSKS